MHNLKRVIKKGILGGKMFFMLGEISYWPNGEWVQLRELVQ